MMDSIAAWAGAAAVLIVVAVAAAIRAIRRARRHWMRLGRTRQLLGQWGAEARLQQLEADLEAAWLAGDRAVVRSAQRQRQIENLQRTNEQLMALLEMKQVIGDTPAGDGRGRDGEEASPPNPLSLGEPAARRAGEGENGGEPLRRVINMRGITIRLTPDEANIVERPARSHGVEAEELLRMSLETSLVLLGESEFSPLGREARFEVPALRVAAALNISREEARERVRAGSLEVTGNATMISRVNAHLHGAVAEESNGTGRDGARPLQDDNGNDREGDGGPPAAPPPASASVERCESSASGDAEVKTRP